MNRAKFLSTTATYGQWCRFISLEVTPTLHRAVPTTWSTPRPGAVECLGSTSLAPDAWCMRVTNQNCNRRDANPIPSQHWATALPVRPLRSSVVENELTAMDAPRWRLTRSAVSLLID